MHTLLIVHRGALGDFILTWPALTLLRQKYPDHALTLIGRPVYCRLAVELKLINNWHDCESPEMLPLFTGARLPAVLDKADHAVLWLSAGEAAARLLAARGTRVLLAAPFPPCPMHVARYHLETMARFCGLSVFDPAQLRLPKWSPTGSRMALVHPGSGSAQKKHSLSFYQKIFDLLQEGGYQDVRFVLGPAEAQVTAYDGHPVERPGTATELAHLLTQARLYIGNDSGASHLAGVLGVPSIVFYKSTDPAVWGVMGPRVRYVTATDETTAAQTLVKMIRDQS